MKYKIGDTFSFRFGSFKDDFVITDIKGNKYVLDNGDGELTEEELDTFFLEVPNEKPESYQ
ncbi:hypothetical protein ACWKTZ_26230 [Bacillus cereus]